MFEKWNDRLFEGSGKVIRRIAMIEFYLGEIAALVCAIAFSLRPSFNFLRFIVILVAAAVSVLISSVLLNGIGEAIENIARMRFNSDVATLNAVRANHNMEGKWVCDKCYVVNEAKDDRGYANSTCKACKGYHSHRYDS